ncbi:hypothetical protein QQ045_021527 [Rhodiola kirilowii]
MQNMDDPESNSDDDFMPINTNVQVATGVVRLKDLDVEDYTRGCCILSKDVNYILGLPMGGCPIKVHLRTIPHKLIVQTFRDQYGGPRDNAVSYKRIFETIQSFNEANDYFKLNFLVLFYSTIVDSTKMGKSNQRILNVIEGLDDIRALNWCEFLID